LVGEIRRVAKPKSEVELPPEQYNTAIVRITVSNTSPNRQRKIPLRRDLPPEIRADDVLDPGGLTVGTDFETGGAYVARELVLDPGETVVFDVQIRDKWNVNMPRAGQVREKAQEILGRVNLKPHFNSVAETLEGLIGELEALEQETGPEEFTTEYVAFYRDQAKRLDAIEEKIYRIEAATRPIDRTVKLGFPVKPPSMKTTWLIIYIILGFLGFVSLLFFLRWYGGRGQAERIAAGEGGGPRAEEEADRESGES
jgi:hypothetical protein